MAAAAGGALEPRVSAGLRIAYDARMSLGAFRGMGRYLRTLIAGREHDLLGLCAAGEGDADLCVVAHGAHFHPLWEQVCVPRLLREREVDIFLAPFNTAPLWLPSRTRLILVVHDLIFMEPLPFSRSLYQNAGRLYRRLIVPHAVRRADLIVTVSNYTAQQVVSRFGVDERRLRIIPNSIDESWFGDPAEPRENARTVLAVAGEAPSKNLRRALAAFALCSQRVNGVGLRMKIAGVKPAFHAVFLRHAAELGVEDAVEFLPYVSEFEMQSLYRDADVLLMPSLAEGFGIPVLEAMASGVPVASSHATSLPEVGGDAAAYFDPLSVEDMAGALGRVLGDYALRKSMALRGLAQARRFCPETIRTRIEAFWSEVAAKSIFELSAELTS